MAERKGPGGQTQSIFFGILVLLVMVVTLLETRSPSSKETLTPQRIKSARFRSEHTILTQDSVRHLNNSTGSSKGEQTVMPAITVAPGAPRLIVHRKGIFHRTVADSKLRAKLKNSHNRAPEEDDRCMKILEDQSSQEQINTRKGLVYLDCHGQWGNRIGEYVVARAVAEELDYGLQICPVMLQDNYMHGSVFPNVVGLDYNVDAVKDLPLLRWSGHRYPVSEILAEQRPRVLHFDGYPFRNYEIIRSHKDDIRTNWLKTDESCLGHAHQKPTVEDVVVHLRAYHGCGKDELPQQDILTASFVDLPFEYYEHVLEDMRTRRPWQKLWVCSRCGEDDPTFKHLQREYGAVLAPETDSPWPTGTLDWLFLKHAHRLVMSQSTYAWWAAFLGDAVEIHYPLVGDWWGHSPRHTLYPVEESRYVFHDLHTGLFNISHQQVNEAIKHLNPKVHSSSPADPHDLVIE